MKDGAGLPGPTTIGPEPAAAGFRHEALFYGSEAQYLDGTAAFIEAGLRAEEPVLVVVAATKIERLRRRLGARAAGVDFLNMEEIGRNPARIIPAWRDYVAAQPAGQPVRGIGEPVWAGRGAAELVEAQHHEALLNVAFAHTPQLSLLCPYDVAALGPEVIDEARRTHPTLQENGHREASPSYLRLPPHAPPLSAPLPEPSAEPSVLRFEDGRLGEVRELVRLEAEAAGLHPRRAADLILAVDEVAANSVRHGGGAGTLRVWHDGETLTCETHDAGTVRDALVGRERPRPLAQRGRGLWLANQLCDLVQLRSSPAGTTIRLTMRCASDDAAASA